MLLATTTTNTMQSLLTDLGTVVTQSITWVGDVADVIVSTPLLLATTGVFFLGATIGIFGRLLSRG